jgi:amino acid transporter
MSSRIKRAVLGPPRDVKDPQTYHAISLVALLAWVGLGADGLSSSAYGPDEAFRALGQHTYLAVALAAATAVTVLVISIAYAQIIRRFPFGGGGYVVASELLGPRWGVASGSALLIDYVLTISVSIAGGADQVFSVLPAEWHRWKLLVEASVIGVLILLNLRGVKESVTVLAPIFGLFLVTHAILIVGGLATHLGGVPRVAGEVSAGFSSGLSTLGAAGLFAVFVRAYSMGAGTYTGIEAVSNGLQIMREPKIETARKTMTLMAISLAVTAGGILILYLLFGVHPAAGKTMNAVLLVSFAGGLVIGGVRVGYGFVVLALAAEAALLFVAAQAGFIDGPRVMSSMATDSWLPHRFAQLSSRLTIADGVLLMGVAALATLVYTRGSLTALVTMYSINVFVTFSLSQLGMVRYWLTHREPGRGKGLWIHGIALGLCASILCGVVYEKFALGGVGDAGGDRAGGGVLLPGAAALRRGEDQPAPARHHPGRAPGGSCHGRAAAGSPAAHRRTAGGGIRRAGGARHAHRAAHLPGALQELRLRLHRSDRRRHHEGGERGGAAANAHRGQPAALPGARQPLRAGGRDAPGSGNRRAGRGGIGLRRDPARLPEGGVLPGQAGVQARALLPAGAAQRDRLPAAAASAVRRDACHGAAGAGDVRCGRGGLAAPAHQPPGRTPITVSPARTAAGGSGSPLSSPEVDGYRNEGSGDSAIRACDL